MSRKVSGEKGKREEALNAALASVLRDHGLDAEGEYIHHPAAGGKRFIDVWIQYHGLRICVEAKIEGGAVQKKAAAEAARERVEEGISQIGIAVIYPNYLKTVSGKECANELEKAKLSIRLFSEAGASEWHCGDVQFLAEQIRSSYEQLVQEDIVSKALQILNEGVETVSSQLQQIPTGPDRVIEVLGMGDPGASNLAKQKKAATRIAALVLANALIFQEELAANDKRVKTLGEILGANTTGDLVDHWHFIVNEIDYVPIFMLSSKLLSSLPAQIDNAIETLISCAKRIVKLRAALKHDLMGRIYHRLLIEAKFLGTYYTSIPAATMLLKLALAPQAWHVDWENPESVAELRIADIACGTGTLLMATVKAIVDNHIQACVDTKHQIDEINLRELHKLIIENSIWGYDVVASAVHLTASTLALLSPEVSFDGMNLYCLPLGGNASRMGSIDFITEMAISSEKYKGGRRLPVQADLFGVDAQTEKVTGSGSQVNVAEIPPLDLCVMNPPFTRSVGGNLLFGSLPQSEKASLQKRLRELLKTPGILAQGTAGLGAVFVAVGDQLLKEKGRQALVLPLALLAGVAWKETRTLLSEKYSVEYIVVSHDPSQWNFSENTELSEVLVVARKTTDSEQSTTPTHWINLWRNPTTAVEAMSVCDEIKRMAETKNRIASLSETGISQIQEDGSTWGEVFTTDDGYQKDYLWWPYAFAQTELTRLSSRLARGELKLPGQPTSHKVPLCPLDQLGELGPDRRDIHDGFKKTDSSTPYAAFWGHDSNAVNSLIQEPNAFLAPLATPLEGRPKRPVELLWPKASHLLIAERMRLNTVRFPAIYVTTPVLSNVWWPFRVTANTNKEEVAKLLALWFSSTLGLLLLLLNREQTQGPWVDLKKPALRQLPVIDIGAIDTKEKKKLLATFDELANENWMLLCKMGNDPIRARIDNAFKDAFKLPDFSIIRTMLAKEPVITNKCLVGP